jgi:hypothetical protein
MKYAAHKSIHASHQLIGGASHAQDDAAEGSSKSLVLNPKPARLAAPTRNRCGGELRKEFVNHKNFQFCWDAPSIGMGASERRCTI